LGKSCATVGQYPDHYWPAAGHQLVSSRKQDNSWGKAAQQLDNILTITGQQLGISWSAVKTGQQLGKSCATVGQYPDHYWPTAGQQLAINPLFCAVSDLRRVPQLWCILSFFSRVLTYIFLILTKDVGTKEPLTGETLPVFQRKCIYY
jgi:hypothetical protein